MYAIGDDVYSLVRELGLEVLATGGGFDFPMYRLQEDGPNFTVLSSTNDMGPENLSNPAIVNFCFDFEWLRLSSYRFETTRGALLALSNPDFRAAVLWASLEQLDSDDAEAMINSLIGFTPTFSKVLDEQDRTMSQAADLVISCMGGAFLEKIGY